tara:strand:+ start:509 stop:1033 length:525 start_codon:yes stop_codon:yes gene_type:complete
MIKYRGMLQACGTEEEVVKAIKLINDNCKMAIISIDYTQTVLLNDSEPCIGFLDLDEVVEGIPMKDIIPTRTKATIKEQFDHFYTTYRSDSKDFLGSVGIPLLIQPINLSDTWKNIDISLENMVNDLGDFMPRFYNKTVDGFDPVESAPKQGVIIDTFEDELTEIEGKDWYENE